MLLDYLKILAPAIGLMVNAIVQVLVYRYAIKSLMKSVFVGYLAGAAGAVAYEHVSGGYVAGTVDYWLINFTNLITYTALAFCYFIVIGLGLSLRIRMLYLLSAAPNNLSHEEFVQQFDAKGLLERRLRRLIENGQIKEEDGKLRSVNSIFLQTARLNVGVKRFMLGKTSEFDDETASPGS